MLDANTNARLQNEAEEPPLRILSVCGSSPSSTPRSKLPWLGPGAESMNGWHLMEHVHTLASRPLLPRQADLGPSPNASS